MGFGSKCSILNEQVIFIEKSKLNIADMRLIPLDGVTYKHMNLMLDCWAYQFSFLQVLFAIDN